MLDKIVVDEKEYPVSVLTDEQKDMVRLFEKWTEEGKTLRDDLLKSQAALRDLTNSLIGSVRASVQEANKETVSNQDTAVNLNSEPNTKQEEQGDVVGDEVSVQEFEQPEPEQVQPRTVREV